jgi:hypothetical protein
MCTDTSVTGVVVQALIYETVIVGGEHDATGMRYATESQAREGYRRVVAALRPSGSTVRAPRRPWPRQHLPT